jgi:hypothetical protein
LTSQTFLDCPGTTDNFRGFDTEVDTIISGSMISFTPSNNT